MGLFYNAQFLCFAHSKTPRFWHGVIITTHNFCVSRTAKTPRFGHGVINTTCNFCVSRTAKTPRFWHGVIITTRNFCVSRTAKTPCFGHGVLALFDAWQCPTLAWGDPTLPSALRRFTSEFGMGSGGTTALWPPGKFCFN